jgi:hypothetical protein
MQVSLLNQEIARFAAILTRNQTYELQSSRLKISVSGTQYNPVPTQFPMFCLLSPLFRLGYYTPTEPYRENDYLLCYYSCLAGD